MLYLHLLWHTAFVSIKALSFLLEEDLVRMVGVTTRLYMEGMGILFILWHYA